MTDLRRLTARDLAPLFDESPSFEVPELGHGTVPVLGDQRSLF